MADLPVSPLAELPDVLRSKRLPGLREKMLAMVCLTQVRLWRTWRMIQLLETARAPSGVGCSPR